MSALLASAAAVVLLPLAMQVLACSTDAVGVESCRTIEAARCALAPKCASVKGSPKIKTADEVANCTSYYHDHCLVGIENTAIGNPATAKTNACVAALKSIGNCQSNGNSNMLDCANFLQVMTSDLLENPLVDIDKTPCEILDTPEKLKDCFFVESQTTATSTATATTGTGGAGGAGGGS